MTQNARPLDVCEFVMANLYGRRVYQPDDSCIVWARANDPRLYDFEPITSHAEYLRLHARLPEISL